MQQVNKCCPIVTAERASQRESEALQKAVYNFREAPTTSIMCRIVRWPGYQIRLNEKNVDGYTNTEGL